MLAKTLESGKDQAARLPQENQWTGFLASLDLFSEDFMRDGREEDAVQEREAMTITPPKL